jgi:hypothetical protein
MTRHIHHSYPSPATATISFTAAEMQKYLSQAIPGAPRPLLPGKKAIG